MQVIARRFLIDRDDAIDLATGEVVRLWTEAPPSLAEQHARAALCDRLAGLRHPLLLSPLDYGCEEGRWFEAYPSRPALRAPARQLPDIALHAIRFLTAESVALTTPAAERVIRPAIDGPAACWRPLGIRLQARAAIEEARAAIDAPRPPGVVRLVVTGARGSGLTTLRLQLARVARLAGYVVLDRGVARGWAAVAAFTAGQHVCIFDSREQDDDRVPAALVRAAAASARRHLWVRFQRRGSSAPDVIALDRLGRNAMHAMLFIDDHYGPSAAEVAKAVDAAQGLPGRFVEALSGVRPGPRGAGWVHETSPVYSPIPATAVAVAPSRRAHFVGSARLERALARGERLASLHRRGPAERVLSRCAAALAARGMHELAARAACVLGETRLEAGRVDRAADAFGDARQWSEDETVMSRALIGSGRAALDRARFSDAEAAFRTACAGGTLSPWTGAAVLGLAESFLWLGRCDEAIEWLNTWRDRIEAPAWIVEADVLALRCRRAMGDLVAAQRGAAGVLAATDRLADARIAAEACLAVWTVHQEGGDVEASDELSRAALTHARRARLPMLVLRARAARTCAVANINGGSSAAWRRRLERAASRLPPLREMELRAALGLVDENLTRFVRETGAVALLPCTAPITATDALEELLDRVYGAPDEGAALEAVTIHARGALRAATAIVYGGSPPGAVAASGPSCRGDLELASRVIDGGQTVLCERATREAGEPVRYGGSTVGAIVVRWAPGTIVPAARARQQLRLAAAACAPLLRAWLDRPAIPVTAAQHPDDLLGPGPLACAVREAIRRAALAPYPVLIEGESGSGKELAARAIHVRSARRVRRFCAVNCAALTDDLVEAELFGHAKGAFTGAVAERPGLFEEADGGTLFLDEVSELSPRAQAKLLRVLQEGEVRRVGENLPRRTDVRVIGATNRPLAAEVAAGRFRPDLRFRLDVVRVVLPPLRDRPDDVPWLAQRFWADAAERVGTRATLSPELIAALARYDWPGNVRELQNVIAALAVHGPRRGRVAASALPAHLAGLVARTAERFEDARAEFERRFVRAALARAGGQRAAAAAQLGVTRQGLAKMMKRLGISVIS